jgi:hypothetical protein
LEGGMRKERRLREGRAARGCGRRGELAFDWVRGAVRAQHTLNPVAETRVGAWGTRGARG